MVTEVQEFFRKRAEIELEYSIKLEKLAKHFVTKQKQEKLKYAGLDLIMLTWFLHVACLAMGITSAHCCVGS